jgi:hypothetical protein
MPAHNPAHIAGRRLGVESRYGFAGLCIIGGIKGAFKITGRLLAALAF